MNSAPQGHGRRTRDLLAAIFLVLVVLLFFREVLFGGDTLVTSNMSRWLPWRASASIEDLRRPGFRDDAAETYFPRRYLSWMELHAGRIPLWNPYILCGTPHLADFQSAVFHPVNLLLNAFDPLWAAGAFVAVHLFLAALFLYLMLREFRIGPAPSLIGALSFLFNAYFATYLGHPPHIATGCWMPLLFLLAKRRMDGRGGLLLPASTALAVLGGFPQTLLYALLALAAFALHCWAGEPRPGRGRAFVRVGGLALLLLLGVGLTLFQILPTAELGRLSGRSEIALGAILTENQPGPWALLRVLLPDFFGNPVSETYWLAALYGPLSHPSDLGFIGYAGVIPFLLAVSALFLSGRREVRYFAGLAAVALLLAFSAGVFSLFYHVLPLARFSSGLHRLQFPFLFAVASLAGFGADEVFRRAEGGSRRWAIHTAGAWLLLLPIGAAALYGGGPLLLGRASERLARAEAASGGPEANPLGIPVVARHYLTAGREDWVRFEWNGFGRFALLAAAGAALVVLATRGRRARLAAAGLLVLVVAADGWMFARLYYTPQPRRSTFAGDPSLAVLRSEKEPFRVARFTWEYLLPSNTGLPYGIEDLQGANALLPREYGDLFLAVDPLLHPDGRRITPFRRRAEIALPLWDLLGVRYFLLSPPRPSLDGGVADPERLVEGLDGLRVVSREPFVLVENTEALPRAFLRHSYRVETDRSRVLREVTSPEFDPIGAVWVESAPPFASEEPAVLPDDGCTIISREGATLTVRTRSDRSALLFVGETYFPGWEATVDRARAPILRADYAFRAVALSPGEHEVVFRYRPRSFRTGLLLSSCLFGVYMFWVIARRRGVRRDLSR
jgi:hypothetical protein